MKKLLPEMFSLNGLHYRLLRRKNNFLLYDCRKNEKIQGLEIVKSLFVGPNGSPAITDRNAVEILPPMPIKDVNHWQFTSRLVALKKFDELWMHEAQQDRIARKIAFRNLEANKQKLPEKTTPKINLDPMAPSFWQNNLIAQQLDNIKIESEKTKADIAARNRLLRKQENVETQAPLKIGSGF
jgi:hypothetical protein